jgi:hypothetical protein
MSCNLTSYYFKKMFYVIKNSAIWPKNLRVKRSRLVILMPVEVFFLLVASGYLIMDFFLSCRIKKKALEILQS